MKNSIITIMLFVLFATSLTACDLQKDPALIESLTETSGEVYKGTNIGKEGDSYGKSI